MEWIGRGEKREGTRRELGDGWRGGGGGGGGRGGGAGKGGREIQREIIFERILVIH